MGKPDGNGGYRRTDDTWYNRESIAIYIVPDVETEPFAFQQETERVRQVLADFMPIQVRTIFVLRPGVVVEEPYDATAVHEDYADVGYLAENEVYDVLPDMAWDRVPEWRWLLSNDLAHRSVDTATTPVITTSRTAHIGLLGGPL